MKEELIEYLKTKYINNVTDLWCESKNYYRDRLIEMGGGYASFGEHISVIINNENNLTRFKVNLSELK